MAVLLNQLYDFYHYVNEDLSDPRSRDTLFLLNPILMTLAMVFYYKLVKVWGPKYMENREPFKLDKILIAYNTFQILSCGFIFVKSVYVVWWSRYYSVICQPVSWEHTPIEMVVVQYVRYYYYLKCVDLLDTIFFVLRKKNNQVSFLHVYHHIIMIFSGFLSVKYVPGGHGAMLGTINCFVHSVMYSYYLLTTFSSETKKRIWWKKYLTQIQLLQFILLFVHFTHILFRPSCTYPKWISLAFLPQNLFMISMFGEFYYREYIKKKLH